MCQKVTDGVFYTDPLLARFAAWFARDLIPKGDYTLLDPCCGSGNLFLNNPYLGSPTVIASDLTPTLPNAIKANFLTVSAKEYLDILPPIDKTKPILIFVNPPYRGDADQSAESISYEVHPSIKEVTGGSGAIERCNCFLAQLVNVAKQLNIPTQLILISKCNLLGSRTTFQSTKNHLIKNFEFNKGFIVNSKEFFKCKGKFSIAISVWEYFPDSVDPNPIVSVLDLTHLKKKDLVNDNFSALINNAKEIAFGVKRVLFKTSFNLKRSDFIRNRKKHEIEDLLKVDISQKQYNFKRGRRSRERGDPLAGGLPLNDRRCKNKCAYGESTGNFIGFMDDLTPCRIKKAGGDNVDGAQPSRANAPWFRLNSQFMDITKTRCFSGPPDNRGYHAPWFHLNPQFMHVKINRCFSGPPDNRGYHASDLSSAQKCFVWYALARTLRTFGYPMWAASEELWVPSLLSSSHSQEGSFDPADTNAPLYSKLIDYAFAIGFAENECVETVFPANNPVEGAERISISNPMTANNPNSFWETVMRPQLSSELPLVQAVDAVYREWATLFINTNELDAGYEKPYFIEPGKLFVTAGLVQIKDYAETHNKVELLSLLSNMKEVLKETKKEFYDFLVGDLDYFGNSNGKAL